MKVYCAGVIICSDGTAIGVGGSYAVRQVALEVSGTDEIGTPVQAIDGNCYFEGTRDGEGFRANAVSGCEQGLSSIGFILLEDGSAALNYKYDIEQVPAGANGIRCKSTPEANVKR